MGFILQVIRRIQIIESEQLFSNGFCLSLECYLIFAPKDVFFSN